MRKNQTKRSRKEVYANWARAPSPQTSDWVKLLALCAQVVVKWQDDDTHPQLIYCVEQVTATTLTAIMVLEELNRGDKRKAEREFKQCRRAALRAIRQPKRKRKANGGPPPQALTPH